MNLGQLKKPKVLLISTGIIQFLLIIAVACSSFLASSSKAYLSKPKLALKEEPAAALIKTAIKVPARDPKEEQAVKTELIEPEIVKQEQTNPLEKKARTNSCKNSLLSGRAGRYLIKNLARF